MALTPKDSLNTGSNKNSKGSLSPVIRLTPSSVSASNLTNTNIRIENAADLPGIDKLYTKSFGSAQPHSPVSYLRDATTPVTDLCLVAEDLGEVVGTLRFWPVMIGPVTPALLLGPIAVAPGWHSRGLGAQMINLGLGRARDLGHKIVLLVGDGPYYGRFGFTRHLTQGVLLATPVETERFLGLELVPGAMHGVNGDVRPVMMVDSTTATTRRTIRA
jgi:predicted N-acetyltransferase YhbS